MTTIIVTHENNETDEFVFDASRRAITLGRRTSNDVCIPDLSVSGNHATLTINDTGVILEDLNSTNGTYVNGEVVQRTAISPGDEIILGKILVSFSTDSASSSSSPESSRFTESADGATVLHRPETRDLLQPLPRESAKVAESDAMDQGTASGSGEASNHVAANEFSSSASNSDQSNGHEDAADSGPAAAEPMSAQSGKPSKQPHPLDGIEHLVVPTEKPTATPMHELDSPHDTSKGAVIEIKNGAKSGQILPIDKPVTTLGRPGIQIAAIMRKPDGYFLMHIESDDNIDRPTLNNDSVGDEPVLLHSGDELTVAGIDVEFMLS